MNSKLTNREISEKNHFNVYAEKYDENYQYSKAFTKYKISKKIDAFIDLIKRLDNKKLKILEIGCGTGEYTAKVAKLLPEAKIVAIDISEEILKVAKLKCNKQSNISFMHKSVYETKMKANSFDFIFGFYILHHLDVSRFRDEAIRLLKPGGMLFFYEPNILNPVVYMIKKNKYLKKMVGDSPHEWAINPLKVKRQLKGLKVVNILTTEYIWPISLVPTKVLIQLDKATQILRRIPLVNLLGGSVQIIMKKE